MKSKKIISGLLALTFVLGGAALPNTAVNNSVAASAATGDSEVLTYGVYKYTLLEDGTAEIVEGHFSGSNIEIPAEINGAAVTSIGEYAFDNGSNSYVYVENIVIPDSVTEIKDSAFENCTFLGSITLSKNLKYIGSNAFSRCEGLRRIVIPDSVTEIKDNAFEYCTFLGSITLSKNLERIGSYAFLGCEKLKSIAISDELITIGDKAFAGCGNIETIVIPDSVEYIGESAFLSCKNLKSITLPEGLKQICEGAFMYCDNLESIVIPDSVESIGASAFNSCSSLKSIELSEGLKQICDGTFQLCDSLESIVIPDSVESIGDSAFSGCSSLKSIKLSEGLTQICDGTFQQCVSLESIVIPDNVENIGQNAFIFCSALNSVSLPKNLKHIGKNAFRVTDIKDIVIPEGVETIGKYAFADCDRSVDTGSINTDQYTVTIPESVTDIGDRAFSNLSGVLAESDPSNAYKPSRLFIINCCKDSASHKYALENGNSFEVTDADDSKTKYPELIKEEYNATYRQFRLNWTAVEGAEQYGIAVKLAGKWKVQAYTDADTTEFTSPKLTSGQSYQAVICAKVNGKWDTSALNSRAFTLVVR